MSNTSQNNESADRVIDAEIIGEARSPMRGTQQTSNKSSKVAWVFLGISLVFIAGIFSEPYAEDGLRRLGWLSEAPVIETPAITALSEKQQQQADEISRLQTALNEQFNSIEALTIENANLNDALELSNIKGDTSSFEAQLNTLQIEINTLKTARIEAGGTSDPLTISLVKKLESDLSLAQAQNTALNERLDLLEQMVMAPSENAVTETASGRMLVAANGMYRKLSAGENYSVELAALEADFNSLTALQVATMGDSLIVLRNNKMGTESLDTLSKQFQTLIPIIASTEATDGEVGVSWWEQLFTVRRTDSGATGSDATIRTIELALARGDLETVTSALEKTTLPLDEDLTRWQSALNKRRATLVASEALFNMLTMPAGDTIP